MLHNINWRKTSFENTGQRRWWQALKHRGDKLDKEGAQGLCAEAQPTPATHSLLRVETNILIDHFKIRKNKLTLIHNGGTV